VKLINILVQLDSREKELNTLKCIFKSAINEHNHYLQTDLLAQLLASNQQYVNNYNNSNINNNNQRNNINTPSPTSTPTTTPPTNTNIGNNSHCSTPHSLDPNVAIFTPNV
jgi:hypothetical protein